MPHILMHMWHFSVNIILKIKRLSINPIYRKPLDHCGQQDLNLHGCPLVPKTSASANSAIAA